jgi:hypothetical protein
MDTILIVPLIHLLQNLPAEMTSVILFGICAIAILLLLKLYGAYGLYLYNIVAVLASNIQVLKGVQFSMSAEPVALGTVVFATTYLCSDILTEHYGKEAAKLGIYFCFAAQILMTLLMVIAVGYPPLSLTAIGSPGTEQMPLTEQAMALLFTPSPRLLLASLLAFAISQLNDIWLFQWIGKLTGKRLLWLRTMVSAMVSALVDTVIFSVLAWVILSPQPVSFSVLIFTYIIGTFITRALIGILSTPIMYLSKSCLPLRSLYVS